MTKTSDEIEKVAAEIEATLNEARAATPNPAVLQRLEYLTGQMASADRDAGKKAREIVRAAAVYYSARKHLKYRGGSALLWAEMTARIGHLRSRAAMLRESDE